MVAQAIEAALTHPLLIAIIAPLVVLIVVTTGRCVSRISRAVTVDIPERLDDGDRRMTEIQKQTQTAACAASKAAADAALAHAEMIAGREDLRAHMASEETNGAAERERSALWRAHMEQKVDRVKHDLSADIDGVRRAISQGDPVGPVKRTHDQGD